MNYFLDTPIKKGVYIPPKSQDNPNPVYSGEEKQEHRAFTWLLHKPQKHAIFPIEQLSGRKKLSNNINKK
jgi:hypothetical protein